VAVDNVIDHFNFLSSTHTIVPSGLDDRYSETVFLWVIRERKDRLAVALMKSNLEVTWSYFPKCSVHTIIDLYVNSKSLWVGC
jgi:hypothetical protein